MANPRMPRQALTAPGCAAVLEPNAPDAPDQSLEPFTAVQTGILFRNPLPHLRSVHGYFPSVVNLGGGELLALHVCAEAFEAVAMRIHLARSTDHGSTWRSEGTLPTGVGDAEPVTEAARLTLTPDGELVALICRWDRRGRTDQGLANPRTLGIAPTSFWTMRSRDRGRTWSGPAAITPPLAGSDFELCSPITVLDDGRWLLPTSTWRSWEGELPNGYRMLAFVSHDRGQTWPDYLDVLRHPRDAVIYWESKIVQQPDGTLLTVAWAHEEATGRDLPNRYALSRDGGKTWTAPTSTGLHGQTMTPIVLDDGRLLCVYRRMDRPGLWAQLARLDGDAWRNHQSHQIWDGGHASDGRTKATMAQQFQSLKFGAPCLCRLDGGEIFLAFWCYEDCVGIIRWYRLSPS